MIKLESEPQLKVLVFGASLREDSLNRKLAAIAAHMPSRACRVVDPFTFFDQVRAAVFAPGQGIDVRPHPHIGLATVTYLFDGELLHRHGEQSSLMLAMAPRSAAP
jgi:redox-sensitive bicupin YhaK (pirin superfamily)